MAWGLGRLDAGLTESQAPSSVTCPNLQGPPVSFAQYMLNKGSMKSWPGSAGGGRKHHRTNFLKSMRAETIVLPICANYSLPEEINPQWSTQW